MKSFFYLKKKTVIATLKIAISILVIWFLVHSSLLNFKLLVNIFRNPILLFASGFFLSSAVIVSAWRWFKLNTAQGIHITFLKTIKPTYFGLVFNHCLPGSIGGDFVRLHYLFGKVPQQKHGALLSILFDRVLGLIGVFLMISLAIIFSIKFIDHHQRAFFPLVTYFYISVISLAIFLLFILLPVSLDLKKRIYSFFQHRKWSRHFISILDALYIYRNKRFTIFRCLWASLLIQILMTMIMVMISRMMGIHSIGFADFAIAVGIAQIANLIPAAPGGLGIGEIAFAHVLLILNPGSTIPFATIFIAYRIIATLVYIPGIIFYFSDLKVSRDSIQSEVS